MKLLKIGFLLLTYLTVTSPAQSQTINQRPLPPFIYGVTVEDILGDSHAPGKIKESLKALQINGKKPFVRIVFQKKENEPFDARVEEYKCALERIHNEAYIMGEILDSLFVGNCDVNCYEMRTKAFVEKLGGLVDVWEIGNEINGEWTHPKNDPRSIEEKNREVGEKIQRAFQVVESNGGRTALTLYYNDDNNPNGRRRSCWQNKENEMFNWAKNYVSPELKRGLDYVFISYYDDLGDCRDDGKKLNPEWRKDFLRLSENDFFPQPKLGFGEVGTVISSKKSEYIKNYYDKQTKNLQMSNYVGGYFWWYFEGDMVSTETPVERIRLLNELKNTVKNNQRYFQP